MEKNYLYKIKDLVCSYDGKKEVLKIEELIIPKGKVVFLLGSSGSGKSTLLETLGLMNRTIKNYSQLVFCPNGEDIAISKLWRKRNEKKIADIRKKHLSFIFQNTNFMPNFTAYENIGLTQMIDGRSKEEAIKHAMQLADSLSLEIDKKKKAYEMSGGEKQRAAFIRAVAPEFTILFGDEPTGNLDRKNAFKLLSILRDTILKQDKTALIVTHDVDHAKCFADIIILIKKIIVGKDNEYGLINSSLIFTSSEKPGTEKKWFDKKGKEVTLDIDHIIDSVLT